jgi:hypothetical protein
MSNPPVQRLSADEIVALKFAAHRQLARWANRHQLKPQEHARRIALIRAVRTLQHNAYAEGCELRVPDTE